MGDGGSGVGWLRVFNYLSSVVLLETELSLTDSRAGSGWIYRWCWIVPPWMWAVSGEVAICPLALSRLVGGDTAYSQDQSQDRQWEARNYRWKLRILYVAVSPFEYHQGDLQYVASYRRRI